MPHHPLDEQEVDSIAIEQDALKVCGKGQQFRLVYLPTQAAEARLALDRGSRPEAGATFRTSDWMFTRDDQLLREGRGWLCASGRQGRRGASWTHGSPNAAATEHHRDGSNDVHRLDLLGERL
ncbi:MAG TPA: hypothetical protein VJT08_07475 [Terriglobales bacterium]|nr:hypothetical protein [Terriglobales bacterium]